MLHNGVDRPATRFVPQNIFALLGQCRRFWLRMKNPAFSRPVSFPYCKPIYAMPYAVLQTDLNPPGIEQLQRAFRSVSGLTPGDAFILGKDAFGILVKNFAEKQAAAMQGALRAEGIGTEIVDQKFLPELPRTHFVSRFDCSPEHLLIYDPLGRPFALEWRHIVLIAAGAVRLTDLCGSKRRGSFRAIMETGTRR